MMRSGLRVVPVLAALALALTACENPVLVGNVDIARNYDPAELRRYGSGGNELRVEVHGDPFGAGAATTAMTTVAAMQGNTIGNLVTFAVEPGQEAKPPSRVVLYFNPRGLIGGETLCEPRTPITTSPGANPLRVSGAWCQSNYVITRADAHVGGVDSLASEPFRALIGQLTIALFPPERPREDSDQRLCLPNC